MIEAVDHEQATELFSAYWEEDLSEAQMKALEEHLRSCVVCKKEYQEFEKSVGATSGLHRLPPPPDFVESVKQQVRKRSRGRFFGPKKWSERMPYEIFSVVMLGIVLAIYLIYHFSNPLIR